MCNSPYNNPMNNDILEGEEMVKIYYILYLILCNIIMSFILVVSAQISETSDAAPYFLISYMVIIFLNILFSYFFAKAKINKKNLMKWTLTAGIIKFFLPFLELIRMILFNNRFFENPIIISIITLIFFYTLLAYVSIFDLIFLLGLFINLSIIQKREVKKLDFQKTDRNNKKNNKIEERERK